MYDSIRKKIESLEEKMMMKKKTQPTHLYKQYCCDKNPA